MGATWRIGSLFGIPIELDFSGVIVAAVIALILATNGFPAQFPAFDDATYLLLGAAAAVLLYVSVLAHELSHALVAKRDGLGVEGITLFAFGGVARLSEEPRSAGEELRMAAAGPACSLLLGFSLIGVVTVAGAGSFQSPSPLLALLAYVAAINVALGVFNLLPGFPLDGGRIFRALLWGTTRDLRRSTWASAGMGQGIALLLVFWGVFRLYEGVHGGNLLTALFAGCFLILTGVFLAETARRSYQAVVEREAVAVKAEEGHERYER